MARQSLPDAEVPDPGRITSQQDFGRELTLARQQAGLTIRDVARASGIPVSTVGDYFAARHLPPARQPELLPSILAACQITDAEQVGRWLEALNRVRRAPGRPPAGPAPYRGLASFQPEDAAWFFGREELALHLVRLATGPGVPGLPLAVVGRGTRLIPLGTPQVASQLPAGSTNQVEFVAFSPDGNLLASGSDDGTVRLWDITDPARPRQLVMIPDAHTYVFSVAFSPRGHVLAAASADDKVRLWNVTDPAAPVQLGGALTGPTNTAYSVAFSPDGKVLAVGSADRDVRLWDVSDPARPLRIGPKLTGPAGYVYSVAFSPGGDILAAGNTDGSVWLWNVARPAHPALIAALAGPAGQVYSVAFGPGGRTLAASDSAGLVWFWDTGAAAAARAVCAMAGQPLTRAEWGSYAPGQHYAPPCR